jgi:hypothetical protein
MGDRQVKNITDPVTVYRVLPDPAALSQARRQRWPVGLLAVLIIGVITILGGWYLLLLQKQIANQAPTLAGTSETPGAPAETAKNSQPVPAPAQVPLERPKVSAYAGNSPDRSATDARNGVNPGGYIRNGQ